MMVVPSSTHASNEPNNGNRIPLTQLLRGQRALIDADSLTTLAEADRCLLRAMGIHESCELKVCKAGAPCIVEVERTRVGLCGSVASQVFVKPCDGCPAA
ncbi:MAG: ferrous iron transport protein A [Planctomycetota bacterium]|jgi:Fe2+ transport system protein FeoA|nr:MAG: ferrous iron transport protein A [Planctomycetota bacterium]